MAAAPVLDNAFGLSQKQGRANTLMWFTLEFESEDELQQCIELLQDEYGVTGELSARPVDEDKWELQVVSEKTLDEEWLGELPGERVESAP
jgi:hypothetical protein